MSLFTNIAVTITSICKAPKHRIINIGKRLNLDHATYYDQV